MGIPCFDSFPDLKKRFKSLIKDDMPEDQQREVGKKLALDYHKELHDELNTFKTTLKLKPSEYTPHDKSAEVEKIKSDYEAKIQAISPAKEQTTSPIEGEKGKGAAVIMPEQNKVGETIPLKKAVNETNPEANTGDQSKPDQKESGANEEPPKDSEGATETTGKENVTGVKKAITEPLRGELGLPKVELPKMSSDIEGLQKAKERVDSGQSNPQELVNRILTEKSGYRNEDEVMDMQYYAHQLERQQQDLDQQLAESKTTDEAATIRNQKFQVSDLQDAQTEAALIAGNQWGKIGNRMQPVINDAGQVFRQQKSDIKEAYQGETPEAVQQKINGITKERDEAIAAKKKIEEQLKEKEAALKIAEMQKQGKKEGKPKGDFKQRVKGLLDELKEAKDEHDQWLKDNGIQKQGGGFTLTGKMIKVIGKIAAEYAKEGYKTVEEFITKVYNEVKDHLPGIEKKHIRDAIAMWQAEKKTATAERLEDKLTPPILDQKTGKPTEAKPPVDIAPKPKFNFNTNTEWVKANQRQINAEYKMKVLKRQAYESEKNMFQKGLMWAGRLTRLSVLSGYNVLYKLAAAATIGGAGKRIPEQFIGRIYQTAFSGIAKKAPIEGYINAKAEAKFYKEFFNPKKFAKNSWEILKTGESDLSKKFTSGQYEHVPGLYLPTDLHQIIKDPVKRATFQASMVNSLVWAEKNGLDITDPLVINSLETAAYKRANYEIFQESNVIARRFVAFKNNMEKKGNVGAVGKFIADFMIPVSTVPTNIVRRLVTTSPLGLIRGGARTIEAYRKGIENLDTVEADTIMRQLKQGSLGTALWLIGWFGAASFGGLYSKFNPNKQRDEGELPSDEMEVNGVMMPKPVQHALPLEIIQWAATARHIYDNYKQKGENKFQSIYRAGMGSIGAVAEQVPIIETAAHVFGAFGNPYEAEKLKEDVQRRFEPQILRETGIIPKKEKKQSGGTTNLPSLPKLPTLPKR
jgi:hypothetical protein